MAGAAGPCLACFINRKAGRASGFPKQAEKSLAAFRSFFPDRTPGREAGRFRLRGLAFDPVEAVGYLLNRALDRGGRCPAAVLCFLKLIAQLCNLVDDRGDGIRGSLFRLLDPA